MRTGMKKIVSALAGLIAIVGVNVGSVQASSPHLPSDKAPLVLEHGSVFHAVEAGAIATSCEVAEHYSHASHASHESHASHYSSR